MGRAPGPKMARGPYGPQGRGPRAPFWGPGGPNYLFISPIGPLWALRALRAPCQNVPWAQCPLGALIWAPKYLPTCTKIDLKQ